VWGFFFPHIGQSAMAQKKMSGQQGSAQHVAADKNNDGPDSELVWLDGMDLERKYRLSKSWQRKHRWLHDGPPFARIDRMIRYEKSALESWLSEHVVATSKRTRLSRKNEANPAAQNEPE
jgi:hypothetical protein